MDTITILENLANKYGTDKLGHGYISHYAIHLPSHPRSLLEIGCLEGASLRMWKEYFPNTKIGTLDLFMEYPEPTDIEGLITYKGSQNDGYNMPRIRGENWEVIIDDGSHNSRDQLVSFNLLAQPGTLYIIEDLHCCTDPFYREGLPFEMTILGLIKSGNFPHKHYLYDDKIVFIEL